MTVFCVMDDLFNIWRGVHTAVGQGLVNKKHFGGDSEIVDIYNPSTTPL